MSKLKLALATLILLTLGVMVVPSETSADEPTDCYELCESLCGSPTASACQATHCDGGTYLCYGEWQ